MNDERNERLRGDSCRVGNVGVRCARQEQEDEGEAARRFLGARARDRQHLDDLGDLGEALADGADRQAHRGALGRRDELGAQGALSRVDAFEKVLPLGGGELREQVIGQGDGRVGSSGAGRVLGLQPAESVEERGGSGSERPVGGERRDPFLDGA